MEGNMKKSKKSKIKTIIHKTTCFTCSGFGYIYDMNTLKLKKDSLSCKLNKCKVCKGTGIYKEKSYIITYKGMAFQVDNIN